MVNIHCAPEDKEFGFLSQSWQVCPGLFVCTIHIAAQCLEIKDIWLDAGTKTDFHIGSVPLMNTARFELPAIVTPKASASHSFRSHLAGAQGMTRGFWEPGVPSKET